MWGRLDETFAFHPKVLAAGLAATGLFARGLAYAVGLGKDGHLSTAAVRTLCDGDLGLAEVLVREKLWDATPTGFVIHDFLDYNLAGSARKSIRKATRDRMRRYRLGDARTNGAQTAQCASSAFSRDSVPDGVAEHCVKISSPEQETAEAFPTNSPQAAVATVSKGRAVNEVARELLDYLNLTSGRAYQPVDANLRLIRGRLAEYDDFTLAAVVRRQWATWKGTDMAKYFRPATLFNAEKCAQYVGELTADDRAWIARRKQAVA